MAAFAIDPSPCTVERKCSSSGLACLVEDRDCQNLARERGLEVTCERVEPRAFVYCPPGAQQRDSSIVWILLAVAGAVVVIGMTVGWFAFRKKLA
jgi:hypothetical protein